MHGPYDDFPCFHGNECRCENCKEEGRNGYAGNNTGKRDRLKKEIQQLQKELDNLD